MKGTRVFPRATNILRSVMIAGAGTALWMALSATGASADTGAADNRSLLGEVTSTVSSTVPSATGSVSSTSDQATRMIGATTTAAVDAVGAAAKAAVPQATAPAVSLPFPNVPLPAPVKTVVPAKPISVPVPVVTPIVEQVAGSVDALGENVPVVNLVVPADTAETVVDTVVAPVTGTVDRAVTTMVPPVNEALKPVALEPVTDVTNPIVQPIVDVVDDVVDKGLPPVGSVTAPVLPPLPGGVGTSPPAAPGGDAAPGVGTLPGSGVVSSQPGAAATENEVKVPAAAGTVPATRANAPGTATAASPVLSISRVLGSASSEQAVGVGSAQEPAEPADLPAGSGSVPAGLAGTGSGNSQNGPPSAAAAFLHGALIIPADSLTDLEPVSDEQHPKPVSFDPGSSPD
ncbi:hypothetical protein [Arthrobacter sp. D5-1]|uniref:hypothetical protein n=1 Tax=Arthrobacter sp. D5-1 TaxID=1477518 RepID=UPI001A98336D|nr:hypothetical protein [Arthrobacter sp. D5-1]QSZ49871.1 hypothetical protein AYX22_16630 [Arthrobacter sp. D5-1]